jgi:manganese/iron transport system permease protein
MDWLIAPLRFGFMQTALMASLLVSLVCASLGVYVVLRRMAFIGDALAHTILPGVVAAYLSGTNLTLGALAAGTATALGIGWFSRRREIREDTAIGILFTGMFALGIVMMSSTRSFRDFSHILFGNILGVDGTDLALIAGVAAIVLTGLLLFHKELELTSYDSVHSEVIGLRTDHVRYGLLLLLALTVVTAMQVVGVVMTSALLITPAATAALLTNRLNRMVVLSVAFAMLSTVVGLYASYYFDIASGGAIVVACTLLFFMAWVWKQVAGTERYADHDHRP